jgi:hypothetical protein
MKKKDAMYHESNTNTNMNNNNDGGAFSYEKHVRNSK